MTEIPHANRYKTQWTEEKTKELMRLLDEGNSGSQIAEALGATKSAVVGKAHRLGRRLNGQPYVSQYVRQYVRRPRPRIRVYRTYAAFAPEYEMHEQGPKPEKLKTSDPCDIQALTTQTCHWPLWENQDDPNKLYCGAPSDGRIYCEHHAFMAGPNYRRPVANQPASLPPSAPR